MPNFVKGSSMKQDISEDDEDDVPLLAGAYKRLVNDLLVEHSYESPRRLPKRRKLNSHLRLHGRSKDGKTVLETACEAKSEGKSSNDPVIEDAMPEVYNRKEKGQSKADDHLDDAADPARSTKLHLERILSSEEINAMQEKAVTPMVDKVFKQGWPNGAWACTGEPVQVFQSLQEHGVRKKLLGLWKDAHQELIKPESLFQSDKQKAFFALARSYKDISFPDYSYLESAEAKDDVLDAVLLHCLDHVASNAQGIKKHNEALKADPGLEVPRDQGYTRPKVLLLLPMRNIAYKTVNRLIQLAQKETRKDSIQGKARFAEDFGPGEDDSEAHKSKHHYKEHSVLFNGNTDDHFRLGIKITRGAVKLYADFFQSDIVVASPIALATKQAEAANTSEEDLDFLSSIEIAVAVRCDVMLMQNWSHVKAVFEVLNNLPKELHGSDVMRIREWYLQGQAKHYRQNILLSSFNFPELKALYNGHCKSHSGRVQLQLDHEGAISRTDCSVHQVFERFAAKDAVDDLDKRFDHFRTRIWPRIRNSGSGGQMIFVPSYLDYVRLRSFLRAEEFDFEGLSEYASGSEVARGRSRFAAGKVRLTLYTERAHFYHRQSTRGVKDLYLYQLPEHAHYYNEIVAMLRDDSSLDANHSTVTVIFSRIDALRLERVVGSKDARRMLKAATKTFMFSQSR